LVEQFSDAGGGVLPADLLAPGLRFDEHHPCGVVPIQFGKQLTQ